jgi:hypothetical protein
VRPIVAALFFVWSYLPVTLVMQGEDGEGARSGASAVAAASESACPLDRLAPVLNDPAGFGARPRRLLAMIDLGPEILFRTAHSVYLIPNHRRQPNFATSYEIFTTEDPQVAEGLLRGLGAEAVLICPGSTEEVLYRTGGPDDGSFYRRLADGPAPDFLAPYPLPGELAGEARLFLVR